MRKVLVVVCSLVLAISVAGAAHIAWRASRPTSDDRRVAAQVAFLHDSIDGGAGPRMQELFPEGEFFTSVLTGMAAANLGRRETARRDWALAEVARALAVAESPRVTALFGSMAFEHGIFWRGWRAQLLVDRATLSGRDDDVAAARREAATVAAALDRAPSGFLESYPGQYWPCDSVVAMSAVGRAQTLWGVPGFDGIRERWLRKIEVARDPAHSGLLVHRVDAAGQPRGGVRGTSQSIIQSFWPDIDAETAATEWRVFGDHFLTRTAGLLGVREYPRDAARQAGDVDSGPLVLGVSLSASATTLAAARRHGDAAVVDGLDREAEVFGLPLGAEKRRFALGLVPVGDAFVAWARSVEPAPASPPAAPDRKLRPLWWAWFAVAALPGVLAALGLARGVRRGISAGPRSIPATAANPAPSGLPAGPSARP